MIEVFVVENRSLHSALRASVETTVVF